MNPNNISVSMDALYNAVLILAKVGKGKEAQALIAAVNVNPAADVRASHREFNNRVSKAIHWIEDGRPTDRTFDGYFEMNDGDALVVSLLLSAQANPNSVLAKTWTKYLTKDSAEAALKLYQRDFNGLDRATWAQHLRSKWELEWQGKVASQITTDWPALVTKIGAEQGQNSQPAGHGWIRNGRFNVCDSAQHASRLKDHDEVSPFELVTPEKALLGPDEAEQYTHQWLQDIQSKGGVLSQDGQDEAVQWLEKQLVASATQTAQAAIDFLRSKAVDPISLRYGQAMDIEIQPQSNAGEWKSYPGIVDRVIVGNGDMGYMTINNTVDGVGVDYFAAGAASLYPVQSQFISRDELVEEEQGDAAANRPGQPS
jgi:hypothetical protein